MIELKYTPWKPTFADASDPYPVQELTMTLRDSIAWDEAVCEFHNFLRAAGYVIPYEHEKEEDDWRGWVPLTTEEIEEISDRIEVDELSVHKSTWHIRFAKEVQNALKELNT